MADASTAAAESPATPEWSTDPSNYLLIGKIGQGAFASVWKAQCKNEHECAVKVLNLDNVDSNLADIRLEVQALRLSSHPNVLACHTAFVKDTNLWLVTQLMRKGSSLHCIQTARAKLRSRENDNRPTIPMEPHLTYILHETLLGLQYIHDNGQIHRDVKAGNILLDSNGDVRIADFGVSGWLVHSGSQQEKAKTFVGTPCWMAPEVMEQIHGYDYKADLWSLGITALELAKGYAPYARYPPMKVLILTIQEDPPSLQTYDVEDEHDEDDLDGDDGEQWSRSFSNMIDTCLQKNPLKRPTCAELLQSKHFYALSHDESQRQVSRERMKAEICDIVEDVGAAETTTNQPGAYPGHAPVSIILSESEDRPAGTTWVFADGSEVLASTTPGGSVEDVIDELDAFERQTGGENYARSNAETTKSPPKPKVNDADDDPDDLDDFMDEFEKTTAGENFRKPT